MTSRSMRPGCRTCMCGGWVLMVGCLAMMVLFLPLTAHGQDGLGEDDAADFERWYCVLISDQPAGSSYISERVLDDRIETEYRMSMTIRRGPVAISIRVSSEFVETLDGQPIEATTTQELGAMATTHRMRFSEGKIEMISGQGGREGGIGSGGLGGLVEQEQWRELPAIDGAWLTPAAARRYVGERLAAGDKMISYRSIDPAMGAMPVTMTIEVGEDELVALVGRSVRARHCRARSSLAPMIVTDDYLDEQGRSLRSNFKVMPDLTVTLVAADRELAEQAVNPPELLASTMIVVDVPIEQPRLLRRARYALSLHGGGGGEDVGGISELPQTVTQQVEFDAERGVAMVRVDLDAHGDDGAKPGEEYLASTTLMNHRDPKLVAMVGKAMARFSGDEAITDMDRCEALRRYVNQVVHQKDLSVGFATASEVARTGQGDCSEHAVLLGALLRGAGIPSRLVSGVIYVEEFLGQTNVFGYHMWAQGWIDGRWVDLDATLGDESRFDAAHIALTASAMTDRGGMMLNDLVGLTPLIGRLVIEPLTE